MKNKLLSILTIGVLCIGSVISFTGCTAPSLPGKEEVPEEPAYLTPNDIEPYYYTSEEELPDNVYYIVRDVKVEIEDESGELVKQDQTRYYPLLFAEGNSAEVLKEPTTSMPERFFWLNYNENEGLLPTMYSDDKLIFKSATSIPLQFKLEKFFDNGYTLGVANLYQDSSGNYRFDNKSCLIYPNSDATGFSTLEAESIYFIGVGGERITPEKVSMTGTINDLELMETYVCDIRTGTEKIEAPLLCNIHYFPSAESYLFESFTFITDYVVELNLPEYITTGYYSVNGPNYFRYINAPATTDISKLSAEDYNETLYEFNEKGEIIGTKNGYIFNERGILVKDLEEETRGFERNVIVITNSGKTETVATGATTLGASEAGLYSGLYRFNTVGKPSENGRNKIYTIIATGEDGDTISLLYEKKESDIEPEEDAVYMITFEPSENDDKTEAAYELRAISKYDD